jgi:putative phosphoesterase
VRVAALYDIHGNLPALEAVLDDLEGEDVDAVVVGGDVIAGPLPRETLELLQSFGDRVRYIRGNADRLVLEGSDDQNAWVGQRLRSSDLADVAGWPEMLALDVVELGRVLFCHATPRNDEEIVSAATPDEVLHEVLAGVAADVVICGHTHHQYDRTIGDVRLVNAGSVGLPYEGKAGAFWALLGPDVELRSSEYDVQAGAARLRRTGYPKLDEYLTVSLLDPIPREQAITEFERLAGRGS